jgi:hypothetical protein
MFLKDGRMPLFLKNSIDGSKKEGISFIAGLGRTKCYFKPFSNYEELKSD